MKIRRGFVSNSSTTSFTCEICGATEAGSDSLSHTDFGFVMCENEHLMCEACVEEDKIEKIENDDYGTVELSEKNCPICSFEVLSSSDAKQYLEEKYKISEKDVLKEIKKTNKRRRVVRDEEYVIHCCVKNGKTLEQLLQEIKEQFKTYDEFRKFLKKI